MCQDNTNCVEAKPGESYTFSTEKECVSVCMPIQPKKNIYCSVTSCKGSIKDHKNNPNKIKAECSKDLGQQYTDYFSVSSNHKTLSNSWKNNNCDGTWNKKWKDCASGKNRALCYYRATPSPSTPTTTPVKPTTTPVKPTTTPSKPSTTPSKPTTTPSKPTTTPVQTTTTTPVQTTTTPVQTTTTPNCYKSEGCNPKNPNKNCCKGLKNLPVKECYNQYKTQGLIYKCVEDSWNTRCVLNGKCLGKNQKESDCCSGHGIKDKKQCGKDKNGHEIRKCKSK
jgi:hypothetical protein